MSSSNGGEGKQATGKTELCPYCKKQFTVTRYGWHIPCPLCGRPLDIFPDPQFFIYINGRPIGIAIAEVGEKMSPLALFKLLLDAVKL